MKIKTIGGRGVCLFSLPPIEEKYLSGIAELYNAGILCTDELFLWKFYSNILFLEREKYRMIML